MVIDINIDIDIVINVNFDIKSVINSCWVQHRKEAIIAGSGTVKEGELLLDEASESAIKFVTPDEIVKRINDTKDTKNKQKGKRDTSAGRPPKKRSSDPEGMETDDPTNAGSTDPAGKADKTG